MPGDPLLNRYARQIILPEVGVHGQKKLKDAKVLLVGIGGLGSPAALYLAAAGVGTLGLCDLDSVDSSNLHRQILYLEDDIARPKLTAAKTAIQSRNHETHVILHEGFPLDSLEEATTLVAQYDLVIDGTDSFAARYAINDACVIAGKPNVHAAISSFQGQLSVFDSNVGPCYRCLFPEPPVPGSVKSCAEAGVLGVLPGIFGTLQASEALKIILGIGDTLIGRLWMMDVLTMKPNEVKFRKDPECPACGRNRDLSRLKQTYLDCRMPTLQVPTITAAELHAQLDSVTPPAILDVREDDELEISRLPELTHIPLGSIADSFGDLDPNADWVVVCRSGMRSAQATAFLLGQGFTKVRNLVGGMNGYAQTEDTTLTVY
jgi:adenylyltransferase/sulfurtransferase